MILLPSVGSLSLRLFFVVYPATILTRWRTPSPPPSRRCSVLRGFVGHKAGIGSWLADELGSARTAVAVRAGLDLSLPMC